MRDFHRGRDGRDRRGGRGGRGGFGRRDRSFGRPAFREEKPVKEGEEYDVEISETSDRGDGIARIKNFVVFVPGTSKGDKVKIRIKNVRMKFAEAEVVGESEGPGEEPAEEAEEEATEEPEEEETEEEPSEETEDEVSEEETEEDNE